MSPFEILLPLAVIFIMTKLLGLGSQKIGLPAVIGMLIAGLLIGLLKYIPCEPLQNMFFSDPIKEELSVFSKVGVVLIMFSTGLGTDLKQLKSSGAASVVITAFGVIVPMALGTLVAWGLQSRRRILGVPLLRSYSDGNVRQRHRGGIERTRKTQYQNRDLYRRRRRHRRYHRHRHSFRAHGLYLRCRRGRIPRLIPARLVGKCGLVARLC